MDNTASVVLQVRIFIDAPCRFERLNYITSLSVFARAIILASQEMRHYFAPQHFSSALNIDPNPVIQSKIRYCVPVPCVDS